jgi:hypothetical protein
MIEPIDDGFGHDAIKRPKIGHSTDLRFDAASDAHVDLIIVAVSVWIIAFAENLRILLSGQAFGVKTVRRRELIATGQSGSFNHRFVRLHRLINHHGPQTQWAGLSERCEPAHDDNIELRAE